MKQRLFFICLLLMVVKSVHAYYDFSASYEGKTIYYNIKGDGATVFVTNPNAFSTANDIYTGSIVIPETVTNSGTEYTVTGIESYTFQECKRLTSITIPNTITTIDYTSFIECTALTSFNGPYASSDKRCLVMDGNLVAFAPSGITSYTIPSSVTTIGAHSFEDCTDLTSITIPSSVTNIGESAFNGCSSLSTLTFPSNNSSKLTTIGESAFRACIGLTLVSIPSTVTSIGYNAFFYCTGLTSLTIPNSVTSIGGYAFSNCTSLSSITSRIQNPQNVSMGSGVFTSVPTGTCVLNVPWDSGVVYRGADQWKSFVNIQEPEITTEGLVYTLNDDSNGYTLSGFTDGLPTDVVLPSLYEGKPITSIGANAFKSCTTLKSIKLSSAITSIESYAFRGCTGLEYISISPSVNSIGNYAFYGSGNLTEVNISDLAAWCHIAFGDEYANPLYYAHNLYLNGEKIEDFIIPDSITEILKYTFYGCRGLTSVTIPESVTSIGGCAFYGCSGLTSVTIPNSITSIGTYAFNGCSGLTSVTIPESVTSIGGCAFKGCTGMTSVNFNATACTSMGSSNDLVFDGCTNIAFLTIGENVTLIPPYAFNGCSGLTSVTIPNSVTKIGSSAFYGCSGLTSVIIPNSVTKIDFGTFWGCKALTSVIIPNSVTKIDFGTFWGCKALTSVTIPESVTSIGGSAFYGCSGLTSVTIPESVTSIESYAFYGCSGLTSVTIPNSVTTIGGSAFYDCANLTEVTSLSLVPPQIGYQTFCTSTKVVYVYSECVSDYMSAERWSNLRVEVIGSSVTNIDEEDFIIDGIRYKITSYYKKECAVTSLNSETESYSGEIRIPSTVTRNGTSYTVTSIGNGAFNGCSKLTSVTIPGSVTYLCSSAFYGCSGLTSVTIPNSVTSIGGSAFSDCSGLTSVTIPNSVTSIGNYAFYSCSGLTSVTIPNSVTSIGYYAFTGCDGLTRVDISDLEAWCHIAFGDEYANPLYCAHNLYLNGEKIEHLNIPSTVTSIGNYAFYSCSGLTSVTIPNSVTTIGEYAFYECSGLTGELNIPNSVISIGNESFCSCSGLTSVIIPNSITEIAYGSFGGCSGLTFVTIPNSVTTIGPNAFFGCSGQTSVTIPNSVTSIEYDAFYGCDGLTRVDISDLEAWCHIAFGDDSANPLYCAHNLYLNGEKIEHLNIPSTVTSIGNYAFYSCSGLTSVTIPNSVTSIGYYAFTGCSGLANIRSEITDLDNLSMGSSVFSNVPTSACKLSVPRLKQSVYSSTAPWSSFTNIVEHFITGDTNIDYGVTVADVSTTISHILGNNPATFDEEAADVNGNGKVNVADATLITNIVLNQPSAAFALPARMPAMFEQASNASLSMSDVAIDELIGHVSVDNASDFVALQFEVNVPEGLIIENVSSDENHTVAFNSIGDNVYRVIIYSLANTPFQSDEVASFSFRLNGNVEVGSEIDFSSVLVNENINGEINEYQIVATPAYITESSSIQQTIDTNTNIRVKNGELLIDIDSECDVTIVSIDGIVFIKHLIPGTNRISLPKGLYIINGMKVIL